MRLAIGRRRAFCTALGLLVSLLVTVKSTAFAHSAIAQEALVHGLWVWKTPTVLAAPDSAQALRDFCRSQDVNEVYLSFSPQDVDSGEEHKIALLIALLHQSGIRVEALLSSVDADQPGKHRDTLLDHVKEVVGYNREHPHGRFDGIHLDVEPQQRPENKGPGNLEFLPNLLDTYRAAAALAGQDRMTVNADIPNKFLKGDLAQRRALLSSVPRVTLMLYELSSPDDGESPDAQTDKLRKASDKYFSMAYQGLLNNPDMAKMAIGLRSPDYASRVPEMLKAVQDQQDGNPHYLGWAWYSYNDAPQAQH